MKPAKFENDLKNLANDLAKILNIKKRNEEVYNSLLDIMVGVRTFNKKVENLITTGELLEEFLQNVENDLSNIFQKDNKLIHQKIMNELINVFTQYGNDDYKANVLKQVSTVPITAWKTGTFKISSEAFIALILSAYVLKIQEEKITAKKVLKEEVKNLYKVAEKLKDLKSSLE